MDSKLYIHRAENEIKLAEIVYSRLRKLKST